MTFTSAALRRDELIANAEKSVKSYAEYYAEDLEKFPYEVVNFEADYGDRPIPNNPKFKTWKEALAMQIEWNKNYKGHKARKRKASR